MAHLAVYYDKAGRHDEAIKIQEEALSLLRKANGPEDSNTLPAMGNLAVMYIHAGRKQESLKLTEEALPLFRKVDGPEKPNTLVMMQNLAGAYNSFARYAESLKLMEEALPLFRKVFGMQDWRTLHAMRGMAFFYACAGHNEQALKLSEELLPLARSVLGPADPETISDTLELADVYFASDRQKESVSLATQTHTLVPTNSEVSFRLATWQAWTGQNTAYEATRRRMMEEFGEASEPVDAERSAYVFCMRPSDDTNLFAKGLQLAHRSVELGTNSTDLPRFKFAVGLAEYRNGHYALADEALDLAEQAAGTNTDFTETRGLARLFRAMNLARQNRQEEAQALFQQVRAEMPPPPQDERRPLADAKIHDRDLLFYWMACKEAKSLIGSP
jgi:tetratricopeptide (TPR) repeat protein